jgi:hypothetical protein
MGPLLTIGERVQVRLHLGYPNSADVATMVLGVPSSIETMFIIEKAMDLVRPEAMTQVRRHLQILDSIEAQMVDDLELLAVTQVDEITIRTDEQSSLVSRYLYWRSGLANLFGAEPNPFDPRFLGGAGGGINLSVQH